MNTDNKRGKYIYFDNAASTPMVPCQRADYLQLLSDYYANPTALHKLGRSIKNEISRSEEMFLRQPGFENEKVNIIWTSGATEANNLAILGYAATFKKAADFTAVSLKTEHASIYQPLLYLQGRGAQVKWAAIDNHGHMDVNHFAEMLDHKTNLIALSAVNNEIGVMADLTALRNMISLHAPEARLLVDGVQSMGKFLLPWHAAGIDMLTLSGHKIHGPGGIGALLTRQDRVTLHPLFHGGEQQDGIRSGSLDAPAILGFLNTAACWHTRWRQESEQRVIKLRELLLDGLTRMKDARGSQIECHINSPENASPYIISLSFPHYDGAVLMRMLGEQDIIVGTGSACAAGAKKPNRVLTALGLSSRRISGTIRISFGIQNTEADVLRFLAALETILIRY